MVQKETARNSSNCAATAIFANRGILEGFKPKTSGIIESKLSSPGITSTQTPFQFAQHAIFVNSFQHHFTSLQTICYLEIAPNVWSTANKSDESLWSLSLSVGLSYFFFPLRDFISDSVPTGHLMNHLTSSGNICSQRLWTLQGNLFLAEVQAVQVVKMIELQLRQCCSDCSNTSFFALVSSQCSVAHVHACTHSLLHSSAHTCIRSVIHIYTAAVRVQHEATPGCFPSSIDQMLLDFPCCLILGAQITRCISAAYLLCRHQARNVSYWNMNYICLVVGYCWDRNHDPLSLHQVLCSAFHTGSPSSPQQPYEKSLLVFISFIQTLARGRPCLVPHPVWDGYTQRLANARCSFIHTRAYQKIRIRIIKRYQMDASWPVIIYGWPSMHAIVSRSAGSRQHRHWLRGTKLSARWMWTRPFLSLYSGRESHE